MPNRTTVEVNGPAIRKLRKLSGQEMRDVAEQAGITPNYLSRIETGSRRRLKPTVYAALRSALGTTDDKITALAERT